MKAFGALVVAAVVVFGPGKWEAPTPGRFEVWLPGRDHVTEMHVMVHDATGLVTDVRPAARVNYEPVANPADDLTMLVVDLSGGRCDDYMMLTLSKDAAGHLHIAAVSSSTFQCISGGYSRPLALSLAAPIDASTVVLDQR